MCTRFFIRNLDQAIVLNFVTFECVNYQCGLEHCCRHVSRHLKQHVGINNVLLCSKHMWLVNITQEKRFNNIFAMMSMVFNF